MRSSAPVRPSCRSDSSCFTAYLMKPLETRSHAPARRYRPPYNTRSENLIDRCGIYGPLNTKGLLEGMSGRCWTKILKI